MYEKWRLEKNGDRCHQPSFKFKQFIKNPKILGKGTKPNNLPVHQSNLRCMEWSLRWIGKLSNNKEL